MTEWGDFVKKNAACKKYEDAISSLIDGAFFNNAAVACERYADFLGLVGEMSDMRSQLERAVVYYSRWGAKKKVEILKRELEDLH